MRDNGTDRDIALQLLASLTATANLVNTINGDLYAPSITTQPVDTAGTLGDRITFSVVADHVKSYQWQYQTRDGSPWNNSSAGSAITANFSLTLAESNIGNNYRCAITGMDDSVIYTNVVHVITE